MSPSEINQQAFSRALWQAVLPPLILMVVLALALVSQVTRLLNVTGLVEHSDRVIAEARDIETLLADLESGLRGYFLTGRKEFLEPYLRATSQVDAEIDQLRVLVSGNPTQVKNLDQVATLLSDWRKYAAASYEAWEQEGAGRATIDWNHGKQLTDTLRGQIATVIEDESLLRDARSHAARNTALVTLFGSLGSSLVAGIVLSFLARKPMFAMAETYRQALNTAHKESAARQLSEERFRLLADSERTARTEAERANRMKDEFLSTLSHELRTPLNAILGWTDLMAAGMLDANESCQAVEVIQRNARVQAKLIEDLLDMSRIISGKIKLNLQRVDIADIVRQSLETVRPAADAKGIVLAHELRPVGLPIAGDPARLQQIVWNLLSNAIKFTPKQGRIQLDLQRVDSHVEITISDTGKGIATEFLPFVFDRFRQADSSTTRVHGGMGLGLSIVKSLVELHGGSVRVESPGEGLGAKFVVTLPLAPVHGDALDHDHISATVDGPAPPDSDAVSLHNVKVLVVDDDPDARDLIRRILTDCDACVSTAGSTAEAIAAFDHDRPDLLLSDIGMPDRDGYDLIRSIRAKGPDHGGNVPAVALTAFARSEDRRKAIRAGFQMHVVKPVEPAELITVLASLTHR